MVINVIVGLIVCVTVSALGLAALKRLFDVETETLTFLAERRSLVRDLTGDPLEPVFAWTLRAGMVVVSVPLGVAAYALITGSEFAIVPLLLLLAMGGLFCERCMAAEERQREFVRRAIGETPTR